MPLPERHILSKSTFMYGNQCLKRLWLHKFNPTVRDEQDEALTTLFQSGTDVGLLAQKRYYGGIDASPIDAFHYQQSVYDTANLITRGAKVIYEAAFQFDGILAAMDIMVKRKDKWYAYEVKSSTGVREPYLQDAALQYHVITNSGIELEDIFILHLNNRYVRKGELDLQQLFTPTSVLEDVRNRQLGIASKIMELKTMLRTRELPTISVGSQCNIPYSCDFQGFCNKEAGIVPDMPNYGQPIIDKVGIAEFIGTLEYPLYFLDLETWSSAVPEQDGQWPYRQMPFQFSLHIQNEQAGEVQHKAYLAKSKDSDLLIFVEELLQSLGNKGSILVYNKAFENTRLRELKVQFEQHEGAIATIQDRLIDLMTTFRNKQYYLPAMEGSYSIKQVLLALLPEQDYTELLIGDGGEASTAFYNLHKNQDVGVVAEIRSALLEYCHLDTLSMVKILEKLRNEI